MGWGKAREREINLKDRWKNENNLLRGLGGESEHVIQSKDVTIIRVTEAYSRGWYVPCRC